jgi:hypothetical protein
MRTGLLVSGPRRTYAGDGTTAPPQRLRRGPRTAHGRPRQAAQWPADAPPVPARVPPPPHVRRRESRHALQCPGRGRQRAWTSGTRWLDQTARHSALMSAAAGTTAASDRQSRHPSSGRRARAAPAARSTSATRSAARECRHTAPRRPARLTMLVGCACSSARRTARQKRSRRGRKTGLSSRLRARAVSSDTSRLALFAGMPKIARLLGRRPTERMLSG